MAIEPHGIPQRLWESTNLETVTPGSFAYTNNILNGDSESDFMYNFCTGARLPAMQGFCPAVNLLYSIGEIFC